MADIITQVSPDSHHGVHQTQDENDFNTQINLNIRGSHFTITRDELMSLPESILLCLFPNGVFVDINGNVITNLTEEDIVYVNYDPACFKYILDSFNSAMSDLGASEFNDTYSLQDSNVLDHKPSIIVLREDLDFYCIPPATGLTQEDMKNIKLSIGSVLEQNDQIFHGLGYAPGKVLGPAEQHLLDMLCSSGFQISGNWGSRTLEPGKTVINSLSLVRLRQHEPPSSEASSSPTSPNLKPVTSAGSATASRKSRFAQLANSARSASRSLSRTRKHENSTSTKLLLFWRKPARKCWWSNESVTIEIPITSDKDANEAETNSTLSIRVHIRRVWTLELSVIGVN